MVLRGALHVQLRPPPVGVQALHLFDESAGDLPSLGRIMGFDLQDTIAAVASAPGGAARGIVRVGGPGTLEVVGRLLEPGDGRLRANGPAPRISKATVRLCSIDRPLPVVLFLWPGVRNYSGQPMAELHTFGSPPLLDALLGDVLAAGARLAEPGEFTLRAFLSGRLDLCQAEAVLGVIEADGRGQLQTALAQLAGGLSLRIRTVRDDLLDLVATLEAGLDFAEEDIELLSRDRLVDRLGQALEQVDALDSQMASRASVTTTSRVVLAGRANVGKSSLFNALVARYGDGRDRRHVALVSDQPGTTRDYLEATVTLGSMRINLLDTAGARDSADELESRAQQLRLREQESADLLLVCLEAGRPLDRDEQSLLAYCRASPHVIVRTKSDLAAPPSGSVDVGEEIVISSVTGAGLDELAAGIANRLQDGEAHAVVAGTAARCRQSLSEAAQSLRRAREAARSDAGEELIALEVRLALEELGRVVGAVYTDDILDRIFSRFCIGK